MSVIRWEEPPAEFNPNAKRYSNWETIAEALRLRPKEWAVVRICRTRATAYAVASQIRNGNRNGMPVGEFEARAADVEGEHRVYARYVGGAS